MRNKKINSVSLMIISTIAVLSGCSVAHEGPDEKVSVATINASSATIREKNPEADSDYFYSQLNEDEKRLFDQIREQCEQFYYGNEEPDVKKSVSGLEVLCCGDIDKGNLRDYEVEQVMQYFLLSCPKYFFLDQKIFNENGECALILKKGYASREVINTYRDQIEAKTGEWLESIRNLDDDLLKEKAAYDYIMENAEYDFDSYNAMAQYLNGTPIEETDLNSFNENCNNIVGFFTDGKVLCGGYARAMQYLCNVAGLDSLYIESGRGEHAWNMVKLFDDWYCIDVTWMDTGGDTTLDSKLVNKSYETFRSNDDIDNDDPMSGMFRYHSLGGVMQKMGPKCVKDTVSGQ